MISSCMRPDTFLSLKPQRCSLALLCLLVFGNAYPLAEPDGCSPCGIKYEVIFKNEYMTMLVLSWILAIWLALESPRTTVPSSSSSSSWLKGEMELIHRSTSLLFSPLFLSRKFRAIGTRMALAHTPSVNHWEAGISRLLLQQDRALFCDK